MKGTSGIAAVEDIVGHHFAEPSLLRAALTHPSAAVETPFDESYERLEFLGDSILGALVAEELYMRFPDLDEGALTLMKILLVSGNTLSSVGEDLGLGKFIAFGSAELGTGARGLASALEDVYEALVAALYLDAGFEVARAFVVSTLGDLMLPEAIQNLKPPKSLLQECTQRDFHVLPEYEVVKQSGPSHQPIFTSVVFVDGIRQGKGTGASKKESEAHAALDALRRMGYR